MNIEDMLARATPHELKKLANVLGLDDSLPHEQLSQVLAEELPYIEAEADGLCLGLDGAYCVASDLLNDMTALSLVLETDWVRNEPQGRQTRFRARPAVQELPLAQVRTVLALLCIATSDDDLGIPADLERSPWTELVEIEHSREPSLKAPRVPSIPAESDLQMSADIAPDLKAPRVPSIPTEPAPRPSRGSIPPGMSPSFDSFRPKRKSIPPPRS